MAWVSGWVPPWVATADGGAFVTMWRIELLHPATVHFPVALTVVGFLFWLIDAFRHRWVSFQAFDTAGCAMICLAALSAWAAVQKGFWADEVVGRELYDPRPLKDHENAAVILAWVMTGAASVDLLRRFNAVPTKLRAATWLLVAGLLLAGNGLIAYTSHLGARLVYQQGAGVHAPTSE